MRGKVWQAEKVLAETVFVDGGKFVGGALWLLIFVVLSDFVRLEQACRGKVANEVSVDGVLRSFER